MNLVEQIARIIDSEGAYSVAYDGTGPNAKQHPVTSRQEYFRAKYECDAIKILELINDYTDDKVRDDLIQWHKDGWEKLGF